MVKKLLEGIKVADFSGVIAGAFATKTTNTVIKRLKPKSIS